jgi:hypothetical protein
MPEKKKEIPAAVRRWYRAIGAKGGQAGRGTPERKELMRQNALKRWAKHRAERDVTGLPGDAENKWEKKMRERNAKAAAAKPRRKIVHASANPEIGFR